ncbi:hypothetical protein LTR62_002316 [Meristemomyces frigidus]|uniref:Vacuolar protein sorting-associated protein 51 homolog n=1 Tax=Meristemomyces frigidus TaxID=1508187 RepID=A0AAN7TMJ7_9PEZI|nr:hypothetical protein LTR62_002316 [Meristemomyces frigidus]
MSTIASPRPSIGLSSRRTSTSTDTTTRSTSTSRPAAAGSNSIRPKRTALRDYYNIKAGAPPDAAPAESDTVSELDRPDFDAHAYVESLLAREGLEGVLKVEAGLVSEIRGLDGEKKALVYDNYSKLIVATDTIRSMREKMDPVTETSSLVGEIGQISERATLLSQGLRAGAGDDGTVERQRQSVKWVLAAPRRFRDMVQDGQKEEAEAEWKEVTALLDRWNGVNGVEEVRTGCEQALQEDQAG